MNYREEDTMWIRSQNKKQLVKCTSFSIQRNFGGKKKSAIVGTVSNASWWGKEVVLGLFDTKEIAQNELIDNGDGQLSVGSSMFCTGRCK